jgi:hypothetical protein
LVPEGSEVVAGYAVGGACYYLWRDCHHIHVNRPPIYNRQTLRVVVIRLPGERGAPRANATECLSDGKVALDTALALGFEAGDSLWARYPRDKLPLGLFSQLIDISRGWRFPTPLRKLLPVPKPGEIIMASNAEGESFFAFTADPARVVAVVLRHDEQELQAHVATLSGGPFLRWELTDHARDMGFDSQFVAFKRIIGREAEAISEYLADVVGRGLFTFPRHRMQRSRKI